MSYALVSDGARLAAVDVPRGRAICAGQLVALAGDLLDHLGA
jgi:hypothetical protein